MVVGVQPPATVVRGGLFSDAVAVLVYDEYGMMILDGPDSMLRVSVDIVRSGAQSAATISDGGTANATEGMANFTGIGIGGGSGIVGAGYNLTFSTSGMAGSVNVDSASFNITPQAASLVVVVEPSTALEAEVFAVQPVVHVVDTGGCIVYDGPDSQLLLAVAVHVGPGSLGSTQSQTSVAGVVAFAGLAVTGSAGEGRLLAYNATAEGGGQLGTLGAAFEVLTVPDAPQNMTALNVTNASVTIAWRVPFNGGSNITSFVVYRRVLDDHGEWDSGIAMSAGFPAVEAALNNFTYGSLTESTQYKFKVSSEPKAAVCWYHTGVLCAGGCSEFHRNQHCQCSIRGAVWHARMSACVSGR